MKIESILIPAASAAMASAATALTVHLSNRANEKKFDARMERAERKLENAANSWSKSIESSASSVASRIVSDEYKKEVVSQVQRGVSPAEIGRIIESKADVWIRVKAPDIVEKKIADRTKQVFEERAADIVDRTVNDTIFKNAWELHNTVLDSIDSAVSTRVKDSISSYDIRHKVEDEIEKLVKKEMTPQSRSYIFVKED